MFCCSVKNKLICFSAGLIILVIVALAAFVLGRNSAKPTSTTSQITPPVSFSDSATPSTDPTADWKTSSSEIFSFKYPESLTLQERQKNYFVLLIDANNPQSVLLSIDARLTGDYANYERAIASAKDGLNEIQTQEVGNGVKIAGKIGPGYGQGQQVTMTLFRYRKGAIEVETTATEAEQLEIYNQILSTFQFLDQEVTKEGNLGDARTALMDYFSLLSEGKYSEAIKYHGSGYEYLVDWNPLVNPSNRAQLLENGCTKNGLHCLKIKNVLKEKEVSSGQYLFVVQFANQDGTLFKKGPCCGATEKEMPTKTDFDFTVKKEGNNYLVITQPVYTP